MKSQTSSTSRRVALAVGRPHTAAGTHCVVLIQLRKSLGQEIQHESVSPLVILGSKESDPSVDGDVKIRTFPVLHKQDLFSNQFLFAGLMKRFLLLLFLPHLLFIFLFFVSLD